MRRLFGGALLLMMMLTGGITVAQESADSPWYHQTEAGEWRVDLYFFWSSRCPHCLDALPVVEGWAAERPWLKLHSHEILASEKNRQLYAEFAHAFGEEPRSVPGFFFAGQMAVGFDAEETTGKAILQALTDLHQQLVAAGPESLIQERAPPEAVTADTGINLPFGWQIDVQSLSLPAVTVVIAGLDAFNPCAFFVLLFLLSVLVHARSRARIAFIGGTFVVASGLIYFLFMAAWLNLFLVAGQLVFVTAVAGLVAAVLGLVNVKDYFRPGVGPSLSISDSAKPGLFRRMRGLLAGHSLAGLVVGAVTLAVVANSYELLCTSGLPMVYTRILTLNELPTSAYYLYLALYNVIYVLPLLTIVVVFTATLGSRKLQESEGRVLKLLSGIMMSGLGLVLLFAPNLMNNLAVAIGLVLGAVLLTWIVHRWGNA